MELNGIMNWLKKKLIRIAGAVLDIYAWNITPRNYCNKGTGFHEKICVVFIAQYIPAWIRIKDLYDSICMDQRFESHIVCVPSDIKKGKRTSLDRYHNDTFDYYVSKNYDAMDAFQGGEWLDLRTLSPDYVFFLRPYNDYMPKIYSSKNVSRYAKVCNILYATVLTKHEIDVVFERQFFRYTYYFFSETEEIKQYYEKRFSMGIKKGILHVECCGIPILENILKASNEDAPNWSFSENAFRIIWTPRWSMDPIIGGSNFFRYKDVLIEYVEEQEDTDLMIRPHPMMFSNFIKTGEMTEAEVVQYKEQCEKSQKIIIDASKEYLASFWQSSVLISDFSSVILDYFVTGKPIIYCCPINEFDYTNQMKRILEGCYAVHNGEELFRFITMLKNGEDPLKKDRLKIIDEIFNEKAGNSSERIIQCLV